MIQRNTICQHTINLLQFSWHKVVTDRMTDKSFNKFVTILFNPIQNIIKFSKLRNY